jgi:hypothetical protein
MLVYWCYFVLKIHFLFISFLQALVHRRIWEKWSVDENKLFQLFSDGGDTALNLIIHQLLSNVGMCSSGRRRETQARFSQVRIYLLFLYSLS